MSEKFRKYDAYYYSFEPTGEDSVNKILSAVAIAGKGYHHTEGWTDDVPDCSDYGGGSYAGWIESSAKECADEITRLKKALEIADETIGFYANKDSWDCLGTAHDQICGDTDEQSLGVDDSDMEALTEMGGKRTREAQKQIKEVMEGK